MGRVEQLGPVTLALDGIALFGEVYKAEFALRAGSIIRTVNVMPVALDTPPALVMVMVSRQREFSGYTGDIWSFKLIPKALTYSGTFRTVPALWIGEYHLPDDADYLLTVIVHEATGTTYEYQIEVIVEVKE